MPLFNPTPNITDRRYVRGSPANVNDDEFRNGIIDSSFVEQVVTGTATWTEGGDQLQAEFWSQTASDLSAILKPVTMATGDHITTCANGIMRASPNMLGIAITDGTLTSSNVVAALLYVGSSIQFSLRHGTLTNVATTTWDIALSAVYTTGFPFLRLRYTAANTFEAQISLNGDDYSTLAQTTATKTMTPTHVGLVVSAWGAGTARSLGSFDFLRYND